MATLIKQSISDICQIISDLRGETTANTDAIRIRAVSLAERDFARRRYWSIHLLEEQTATGDGTDEYTIGSATYPMRPKGLVKVSVGSLDPAYEVLFTEFYDTANDLWKMRLPNTVTTGTTIYYSYYYEPPKKTASNEYIYCSNTMIIVKLALGYIYEGEEEDIKASLARNEAEQLIAEEAGKEDTSAKGQINVMTAVENPNGNKGIGSY